MVLSRRGKAEVFYWSQEGGLDGLRKSVAVFLERSKVREIERDKERDSSDPLVPPSLLALTPLIHA